MAIVLKDRVKETSTTTGTGAVTLLGSPEGYQTFNAIGDGNTTYYTIYNPEDGTWEVGYGTYTAAGTTLSRDAVLANSNGNTSPVDFAIGAKDVFCTYPAEKAIYEEETGNVLIDGGPITVVGQGVTGYTTFSAALGELYADVDSFAQMYAQNYNDGSNASGDFVVYRNDATDDTSKFVDMGINSSNYSSVDYPIFSAGSAYVFNDGGEMFVGSATDDVVLFAGGVDTTDEAVRIDKTTKSVTTVADVNVGGDLNATGGTFTAPVTTTSSMTSPSTTEFVTKAYVDQATSTGLHLHQPVRVDTTGNLTATYNNGTAGVGATLTNSGAQAALVIDGVTMAVNDRVLVWQQSAPAQNGVYVVTTVGSGSTNWVLTRSSDANSYVPESDTGLGGGDYFYVQEGTTGQGDSYVCTNTGVIVFGTTAITFAQFSGAITYTGGTNISVSGQVISLTGTVAATNGGTGTSTIATGDLLYGSGTNTWGRLSAGSAYKSLVMNAGGTNVEWNAIALNQSGSVSGALPATNGGTGQSAYSVGDILYSGLTDTLSRLTGNTTTTKQFLTQTGTGSASAAPAWGTISGSDVNGAVSSATNVAGGAANRLVYQTGSGATGFVAAPVSANTSLTWNGSALTWASSAGAAITDDTTTNATYYPVWANSNSGVLSTAYVSSTKLGFNPSTGNLSATSFTGAWSGIPSGTAMLFAQTAAPTGWTKSTTHNNKALRVVSGTAGSGGTVAFTTAFASQAVSGTVGSTTLTEAQMPAHTHALYDPTHAHNSARWSGGYQAGGGYNTWNGGNITNYSQITGYSGTGMANNTAGSSGSHNHTFSGTAIDLAVQYVDVIIAVKD